MNPPNLSNQSVSVFLSYSHADEKLKDELMKHIDSLIRNKIIDSWHDRMILPGDVWHEEIGDYLSSAQLIIFLVSHEFISSSYCQENEIKIAMERHEAGEARIIPVILRNCMWEEEWFNRIQALPKGGKPVKAWRTKDEAFTDIARGIRDVARTFSTKGKVSPKQSFSHLNRNIVDNPRGSLSRRRVSYATVIAELSQYVSEGSLKESDTISDILKAENKTESTLSQTSMQETSKYQKFSEHVTHFLSLKEGTSLNEADKKQLFSVGQQFTLTKAETEEIFISKLRRHEEEYETLGSGWGINHTELRNHLKADDWAKADAETYRVMRLALELKLGHFTDENLKKIKNKELEHLTETRNLLRLPCQDLLAIDKLWRKYSDGKFGFTVQKEIYLECGATIDGKYPGRSIMDNFANTVGWRANGTWVKETQHLTGTHVMRGGLPILYLEDSPYPHKSGMREWLPSLVFRLSECS